MGRTPPSASDFDDVAAAFADYGTSLRGYVRYQLAQRNLEPFLGDHKPLQILDVGGGSGGDSAWLAAQGHQITFIEPSIEQRHYAERRFNFLLESAQRQRITIAGSTTADLPAGRQFDVVLLHAVSTYQLDPNAFITNTLQFVKPGGLLSLIEKGYYGTEARDIIKGDYSDLRMLHKTSRSVNNLKQNTHAYKPDELEDLLVSNGFVTLEWSGIRVITDSFEEPVSAISPRHLTLILEAEYRQGHHPHIRGQGQLLHFIAQRQA